MLSSIELALLTSAFAAFGFGYLLGSIPFGVLLTRLAGTQDIRAVGSGNIGATNVLRTGHKGLATATLVGDMLKGTIAVAVVLSVATREAALLAALGAFLGHLFPVWLKFKGGKGVATYIGLLLALAWPVALAFCLIWLAVAYATRFSSLSALIASAATPIILWVTNAHLEAQLFLLLSVVLWLRHRENIERLLHGTEGKIGHKVDTSSRA
jgi:acyl phosphate:glycerol-3-phosphate acyltransferase